MTTYQNLMNVMKDMENMEDLSGYGLPWGIDVLPPVVLAAREIDKNNVAVISTTYNLRRTWCDISIFVAPKGYNPEKSELVEETGSCGLRGLLWIKKQLPLIEEWLKKHCPKVEKMTCSPTDKRRESAYRILLDMGYEWDSDMKEYRKYIKDDVLSIINRTLK